MGRRNRTTVLSRVRKAVLLPYHLDNFAGVLCGSSQFARNVLSYHSFDVIASFWRPRDVILGPHLSRYQWRCEHTREDVCLVVSAVSCLLRMTWYPGRVRTVYMAWYMRKTFWQNLLTKSLILSKFNALYINLLYNIKNSFRRFEFFS